MADAITAVAELNGWFKSKQGTFQDPLYEHSKFTDGLGPLQKAQLIGREFRFPVELSLPQGVTYAAAGAGAFAFEETVPGEMKEATIDGSQIVVSDMIDYEAAAKATAEGAEAYGNAGERLVKRIRKAGKKRIEMSAWYGQHYLAQIQTATTVSGRRECTIYAKEWAVGLWTGMKNMRVDVYTSDFVTKRTSTTFVNIYSVNVKDRKITLAGTDFASIANDDVIIPFNSRTSSTVSKEMKGVNAIVTATTTTFGIDPTLYELWSGNTFDNGSVAFSLKKMQDSISDAVGKGLDEKATCFVAPRTWANLCSDQAALRKYDASYSSAKANNGFRSLSMYSQNGELDIMPHPMIKEGEAWIMPLERWMKIGAQDLGFNVPGRGEEYFDNATNASGQKLAAWRLMAYANMAVICGTPGLCTKVSGIVNT